jgi:GNAT superfamily N-acetyltransferase
MIRLATKQDMSELLRMSESFFNASGYSDMTTFNKTDSEATITHLIENKWLLTDGKSSMLGFVVFPMFMNSSTMVAQELFWWVDKESRGSGVGVKILKKAEDLAKNQGAVAMLMLSLNDFNGDRIDKLYEKLGYKRKEQTYMRTL